MAAIKYIRVSGVWKIVQDKVKPFVKNSGVWNAEGIISLYVYRFGIV